MMTIIPFMDNNKQPSKAVLALRKYLRETPDEVLQAQWDKVKAMGLPEGPTLTELIALNKQHEQETIQTMSGNS